MCCYLKSAALNAAEMRVIYSTLTFPLEQYHVSCSSRCGCKLHTITNTHTHTQRDVVADARRAVDAGTSLGRRWQPSAAHC